MVWMMLVMGGFLNRKSDGKLFGKVGSSSSDSKKVRNYTKRDYFMGKGQVSDLRFLTYITMESNEIRYYVERIL